MTLPPAMDRRDVLKLCGAASLACFAPSGAAFAARAALAGPSAMVLADSRYRESLIFAEGLKRQGAELTILGSDLAATWFGAIAPRLPQRLQALAGLTLASDLFILERLAEGSGARTCYSGSHDWRCRQGSSHALSGTIDLDPIAAALADGKESWAANLGQALLVARDGSRSERRLELGRAIDSGASPRFFVSWLMRWTV